LPVILAILDLPSVELAAGIGKTGPYSAVKPSRPSISPGRVYSTQACSTTAVYISAVYREDRRNCEGFATTVVDPMAKRLNDKHFDRHPQPFTKAENVRANS
jgi:hypothetical protein